MPKGKLELTWVGKDERVKLEPRILVEDPGKSFGDPNSENMLIYGNNLLALKALEQEFTGKVKCIYIDPPFNTQQRFEHYDDGLEHSVWLTMMSERLELLRNLLSEEGSIFVHIDDTELGYLLVCMDEVFGRKNRINVITFKQSSTSGPKAVNPGLVTTANFILYYCRDRAKWQPCRAFKPTDRDKRYNHYIVNYEAGYDKWKLVSLRETLAAKLDVKPSQLRKVLGAAFEETLEQFVLANPTKVVRTARVAPKDVNVEARQALELSSRQADVVFKAARENKEDYYFLNGEQLIFYSSKVWEIDGKPTTAEVLSTIWDDILSNNLHKEGGITFPNGKKPELLIKRILELSTRPGDIVLDSFAGSGTTGAVAHKMNRRWIMSELREHCDTHIVPRLRRVVDGSDQDGASKAVGWKGGGGFKYYRLAETLLVRDKELSSKDHPVFVVNPKYDEEMLRRAICKIENFRYRKAPKLHGVSSESRFLHVSTQLLTQGILNDLAFSIGSDQSLLIYCTRQRAGLRVPENIEIKKIPRDLMTKCMFEEGK